MAKVESELDEMLERAFGGQPEVVAKLKEAIEIEAQALADAAGEGKSYCVRTVRCSRFSLRSAPIRLQRQPSTDVDDQEIQDNKHNPDIKWPTLKRMRPAPTRPRAPSKPPRTSFPARQAA
ncbi:hypothetical protein VTK26DRAFT_4329 [Humicola hyalothermophila]